MPSLFDTIKQNSQQLAGQQQGMTDQTSKVQQLLRAKSGQAVGGSDVAASNVGEAGAVDTTNQQLQSLAPAVQMQQQANEQQRAGIAQQTRQQTQAIAQQRQVNTVQNNIKANQILQQLSQDKGQLSQDQRNAQLEQASFLLAMQDKQYTDTLQQVGAERRLNNDINFKITQADIAFGDNLAILQQKLGNQDILAASDRDFQKMLSQMSIDDAIKTADIENAYATSSADLDIAMAQTQAKLAAQAANQQAMWSGIGQGVGAGTQAYAAATKNNTNTTTTSPQPDLSTGSMGDLQASQRY